MRHRVMLTVDEQALRHDLAAANRAWRARTDLDIPAPWPVV